MRSPLALLLSKSNKPRALSCLLLDISSSPGVSSAPFLWGYPKLFTSFNAGAQPRVQGKAIWSLKDTHCLLAAAVCLLSGKGGVFIPGNKLHIKLLLSFAKKGRKSKCYYDQVGEPSSARPILPYHRQPCKEYPAGGPQGMERIQLCLHMQLLSSSHPPQQNQPHGTSTAPLQHPAQWEPAPAAGLAPGMSGSFPATHEFRTPAMLAAAQPSLGVLQAAAEQLALGLRGGSGGAGGGAGPAVLHGAAGRRRRDLHAIHQRLRQLLLCHSCKGHNKCLLL